MQKREGEIRGKDYKNTEFDDEIFFSEAQLFDSIYISIT